MSLLRLSFLLTLLVASVPSLCAASTAPIVVPTAEARRLEILFLGAPTANGPHHDPISRYRVLKKALGVTGINLT
jgi:hypothetical protein